jgi:secreted PhoX family phosphatase
LQLALHSGGSFPTKWVQVHDTATDGTAAFDCNLAARAAGATPFKRPENGAFKPDGTFRTFFFTTTGDTDNRSGSVPGLAARGAWGGIFQLDMDHKQDKGQIHLFALGDATHNSFDNISFGDSNTMLVGEDRGDTLHDQLNTLDSLWAYPLAQTPAKRVVAEGRDASASPVGVEDNEVTGSYVANGDHSIPRQYGTPGHLGSGVRAFFTQQHGDNVTYELTHN